MQGGGGDGNLTPKVTYVYVGSQFGDELIMSEERIKGATLAGLLDVDEALSEGLSLPHLIVIRSYRSDRQYREAVLAWDPELHHYECVWKRGERRPHAPAMVERVTSLRVKNPQFTETEIASAMNALGHLNQYGEPWDWHDVQMILDARHYRCACPSVRVARPKRTKTEPSKYAKFVDWDSPYRPQENDL